MALIIDDAMRPGKKNAFMNILDLCTATYAHGAFSKLGVSATHSQQQNALSFSKTHGELLLYMGFKSIKSGIPSLNSKEKYQRYENKHCR